MVFAADPLWIVVGALAFDALIGDPDLIWRRFPHPVVLFGAIVASLDRSLNRDTWSYRTGSVEPQESWP